MGSRLRRRWMEWRRSRRRTATSSWSAIRRTGRPATRCGRGLRAARRRAPASSTTDLERTTVRGRLRSIKFAAGGTTTLEVEPHGQRNLVSQHWSLVGTVRNCAGGPHAVGQLAELRGDARERDSSTGYAQNHGYIFEVPLGTVPGTPAMPVALRHLGRFAHEAVAVDPATGAVYETEDQGDGSGFYRFMPAAQTAASRRSRGRDRPAADAESRRARRATRPRSVRRPACRCRSNG